MPARRLLAVLLCAAAVAGLLASCSPVREIEAARGIHGRLVQDAGAASFYRLAAPVAPGAPGEVVRTQELRDPPDGSRGYRVLYHSRDQADRDVVVSGLVFVPTGAAPAGGRPVVSWAHPTTGAAPGCAPSRTTSVAGLIPGLGSFLAAGDVVAATDYEGLGVDNPSSYLIGTAEGRNVLDAARAARSIAGASAGDRLLLWGHSQGGQAALFAAQDVAAYAPELRLQGVAVAAPASDLAALLHDHLDDISGVTIGSYAFAAYQAAYAGQYPGLSLASVLTPAGVAATPSMTRLCLLTQTSAIHDIARPLIGGYMASDPGSTPPWSEMLAANSPGGARIGAPIYIAQGMKDELVRPAVTAAFAQRLCTAGEDVRTLDMPRSTHGVAGLYAAGPVSAWFRDVLAGHAPASTCS